MKEKLISYEWAIAIYKGETPFTLNPIEEIPETVITFSDVTDIEAEFVADPFMIHTEESWYMFFEVLNKNTGLGEIGYASSKNALNWSYKNIILKDSIHLSYPFILKHNGEFYMIPETRQANEIRIYKAKSFPMKWDFFKVLLVGDYADATIFNYNNTWWMFALKGTKDLHLFSSNSLLENWKPHPQNPIIENDLKSSRPGGKVILYKEKLYRVAQNGYPIYGNKVRIFEIKHLSKNQYEEIEIEESPILKGSRVGWNSIAMHHIDTHQLKDDSWIACVDGAQPKFDKLISKYSKE